MLELMITGKNATLDMKVGLNSKVRFKYAKIPSLIE